LLSNRLDRRVGLDLARRSLGKVLITQDLGVLEIGGCAEATGGDTRHGRSGF
jgi:hypothetical protein